MSSKPKKEENKTQENRIGYMKDKEKQIYRKKYYIVSNPLDNYYYPKLHARSWWPNGLFQVKRRYCYGETGLQYFYEKNNVEQLKDINSEENTKEKELKNFARTFNEYDFARENDYIITIEYCASCSEHSSITQHSNEMFQNLATNYQKIIQTRFPFIKVILKPIDVDILKEEEYKLPKLPPNGQSYPNVQYINDKFKPCRIGAFEIQLYSKKGGVQLIHSKLYTKQWPKVSTVLGKIVSCMPLFDLNLILYDKEDYTEKEKMDGIQVNVYLVNNENIQEYINNIEDDVGNVTNPGKRLETIKMSRRMKKEALYLDSLGSTNGTKTVSAYATSRANTFSGKSTMKTNNRAYSSTGQSTGGNFRINCDLSTLKGRLIFRKYTQIEKEREQEEKEREERERLQREKEEQERQKREEEENNDIKQEEIQNEENKKDDEKSKSRIKSANSNRIRSGQSNQDQKEQQIKSRHESGKSKKESNKSRQQTGKSKREEKNKIEETAENVNTTLNFCNLPYDTYIIETIENSNFLSSLTLLSFNSIENKPGKKAKSKEITAQEQQNQTQKQKNQEQEKVEVEENNQVIKYLGLYHQTKATINIHLYTETEVPCQEETNPTQQNQQQLTDEKETKPTTDHQEQQNNIEITPITSSSITLTNINTSTRYSIVPNKKGLYEFKTEPGYYKIEIYDKDYESITKKITLSRGLNTINIKLTPERMCDINIKVVAYNFDKEEEEKDEEEKQQQQEEQKSQPFTPIQNAEVSIFKGTSDLLGEGITDKSGKMIFTADTNENSLSILVNKIGYYSAQRFFSRNKEMKVNEETGNYEFNMTFVLLSEKAIMEKQTIIFITYMNLNQKLFDLNLQFYGSQKAQKRTLIKDSQEENGIIIAKFDYKEEDEDTGNNEVEEEDTNLEEEDETNHYEEIVRIGLSYNFEKEKGEEEEPIDIKEKIEYLNKILCEGMIYTPNNSFYVNIPNTVYEDPNLQKENNVNESKSDLVFVDNDNENNKTNENNESKKTNENKEEEKKKKGLYWDLGWLDIKNKLFYETSTFFDLSQTPTREYYFEEWIEFLQKLIDKKIYLHLFEFFNFQKSWLTETDRLLSRATFNNILSNLLLEDFNEKKDQEENAIEVKDISPFIISIMSLPIEDKDNLENDNCISYRLLKKKITSNLKNFSCAPPTTTNSFN